MKPIYQHVRFCIFLSALLIGSFSYAQCGISSIAPVSQSIGSSGGQEFFTITFTSSSCDGGTITFNNVPSWLTVNRSGANSIRVSATANTGCSRDAFVGYSYNGSLSGAFNVNQLGVDLNAGTITGGGQSICQGTVPSTFGNSASASGGNNSYSYQWQERPNGTSTWTNINGATSLSYSLSVGLTVSKRFRRNATSCEETLPSNEIQVIVTPRPVWYADTDNDGFGDANSSVESCSQPTGYVSNNSDYDDTTENITDIPPQYFYRDIDNDMFGDPNDSVFYSEMPSGYVTNNTDACPNEFGTDNGCPNLLAKLSNENSFASRIYQKELNDSTEITAVGDVIENVTYYDGLGRPLQQVAIRASKEQGDLVTHIGYDAYGRVDREWLPLYRQASEAFGSFRHGMAGAAQTYYKNSYASDFTGLSVPNINAYSLKEYEPSPLNRVFKQAAPGEDWKMGSGHEIVFGYDTNDTDEVRFFKVSTSFTNGIYEPILVQSGYYAVGELYKTVTKDENHDGTTSKLHTTESYTDKLGHVVLKRTYGEVGSPSAVEEHDTHYVYDDYGNLTFVLPPKVDTSNGVSSTELDELCYQYKYDHRNRLVEKKVPGKGWEHIVYNKLDQPVMVQDTVQRTDNEWSYTKYDAFGRVAYTGIADLVATRSQAQANVDGAAAQFEERDGPVYTTNTYPSIYAVPNVLHTMNYYDAYDFDLQGYTIPTTVLGQTVSQNVRGLPTGGGVLVLDGNGDKWVSWARAYDEKGRVITEGTLNDYLQTFTQVETKLDFVGRPEQVVTTHTKGANPPIVTTDDYAYDHMGRLTQQTRTIGAHTETIVENTYGELGQLVGKKVGGNLQTVDYEYNVRGWLKRINDHTSMGNDLFAFDINYNTADHGGTPLYNGNISETEWKTANVDNGLKWYRYGYDALNRLGHAVSNNGRYDVGSPTEPIAYDKNGNITFLKRKGHVVENPDNAITGDFGSMDRMYYYYPAQSNKVRKVSDFANDDQGFREIPGSTGDDFSYDLNGNMTIDLNKGIRGATTTDPGIVYNHLDLPESISVNGNGNNGTISYIYDATGRKLKKIVSTGNTTEYAGNYVYENGQLQFFGHPEGYVVPDGQGGYDYVYQYRDHLGNIRLSYQDINEDGSVDSSEILQERNYYPFGLEHKGYNNSINGVENNYMTYQGKELDESLGLDWHDFGARNYDASLGRWMNLDPLAEQMRRHSPYNFAFNNPLRFIDPDGMSPEDIVIRMLNEQGESVEAFRIHTDLIDTEINLESKGLTYTGTETTNVYFDDQLADYTEQLGGSEYLPDALAVNASAEAAYKGGAQLEVSVLGILKGENKGDFGVNLQVNGLLGIEAGVTGSVTGFFATDPNPDLDVFRGAEIGLQADVRAFGPASVAGAYNQGTEFQWPIGSDGNWRGFTKTTYEGISLGVSGGVVPLPVSFSGYLGVSDYLYRSDR
ncbi:hypothetical protein HME9304_00266 [Flagellimonas maritima]|uniref:DUF6443 domain-containing protein n=2 Tax=Flagellimonas maritima TaxID=1383885 RepID=A0A2Z4LNG9_9FLAO|nr:hypothetical protein HME9304_00266 [Allomuricauda aurantiaca]